MPFMPPNDNVSEIFVPFEPNMEDPEVPDFDLVSFLDEIENEQSKVPSDKHTASTTVFMTSNQNVLSNIPKSMF